MSILDQIKDVKVQVYDLLAARQHLERQIAEIDRQIEQRNQFIYTESQRTTAAGEPLAAPNVRQYVEPSEGPEPDVEDFEAFGTYADARHKTKPEEEKVELPEKWDENPEAREVKEDEPDH